MAWGEIYAFGWIGSVLGTAVIASSKNRNGCGWLALALVTGPLALIASVLIPARSPEPPTEAEDAEAAADPAKDLADEAPDASDASSREGA